MHTQTSTKELTPTALTKLGRAPQRGSFDLDKICAILDASPMCHLGYQTGEATAVIPTCHWRVGDRVYWHGSRLSRTMQTSQAQKVCLTVTHLDGLVLARSGFHHSANYRSAMVFGYPEVVADRANKLAVLEAFIEGLFPGRWQTLRPPSQKEMNATTVLSLPLEEGSAKVRSGPPADLAQDLALPIWAGVIPLTVQAAAAQPCPHNPADVTPPEYVRQFCLD